jgi:hypothetical protein
LGELGFDAEFGVDQEIVEVIDLRQEFEALPEAHVFAEFVFETLGDARDEIAAGFGALFFVNKTGAAFHAERGGGIFDQVISDAGAEQDAVLDIGDGIVEGIEAKITVGALGKKIVILAESVRGIGAFNVFCFAVGCVSADADFMLVPFLLAEHLGGEEDGIAIAGGEGEARGCARFPLRRPVGRGCGCLGEGSDCSKCDSPVKKWFFSHAEGVLSRFTYSMSRFYLTLMLRTVTKFAAKSFRFNETDGKTL